MLDLPGTSTLSLVMWHPTARIVKADGKTRAPYNKHLVAAPQLAEAMAVKQDKILRAIKAVREKQPRLHTEVSCEGFQDGTVPSRCWVLLPRLLVQLQANIAHAGVR